MTQDSRLVTSRLAQHLPREDARVDGVGAVVDALLDLGDLVLAHVGRALDGLAGSSQRAGVGRKRHGIRPGGLCLALRLRALLRSSRGCGGAGCVRILNVGAGGVLAVDSVDVVHAEMWTSSVVEWLVGLSVLVVKYGGTAAL